MGEFLAKRTPAMMKSGASFFCRYERRPRDFSTRGGTLISPNNVRNHSAERCTSPHPTQPRRNQRPPDLPPRTAG